MMSAQTCRDLFILFSFLPLLKAKEWHVDDVPTGLLTTSANSAFSDVADATRYTIQLERNALLSIGFDYGAFSTVPSLTENSLAKIRANGEH